MRRDWEICKEAAVCLSIFISHSQQCSSEREVKSKWKFTEVVRKVLLGLALVKVVQYKKCVYYRSEGSQLYTIPGGSLLYDLPNRGKTSDVLGLAHRIWQAVIAPGFIPPRLDTILEILNSLDPNYVGVTNAGRRMLGGAPGGVGWGGWHWTTSNCVLAGR